MGDGYCVERKHDEGSELTRQFLDVNEQKNIKKWQHSAVRFTHAQRPVVLRDHSCLPERAISQSRSLCIIMITKVEIICNQS